MGGKEWGIKRRKNARVEPEQIQEQNTENTRRKVVIG